MNAVARPEVRTPLHFIDGEFVAARSGGTWSRAKPSFRRKVLFKTADLIEARSDEIIAANRKRPRITSAFACRPE